jgi:hypothetical protein
MAVTPEQLAAVRAWREDHPAATVPLEAFGTTWQVPAQLSLDLILWQSELHAEGRTFDDLDAVEVQRFVAGVVGDDVFGAWRTLGLDPNEIGAAAGRAFAAKILQGRESSGEAEAGTGSASTTSSPTGTSLSPTSPASTPPNPFTEA